LTRNLARPWMTTVGKYSYAIYVVHTPVHHVLAPLVAHSLAAGSGVQRLVQYAAYCGVVFGVSLLLALVTWRVIEHPALALKRYVPMPAR
jgi:peptidoglycan/LPS O-acetylase OafA/YrhL